MKKQLFCCLSAAFIALVMAGCSDLELTPQPPSDLEKLSPPESIRGETTQDTIAVSWSAVPEAVTYNVYSGISRASLSKQGSTADTKYTIKGLSPETEYHIAVSVINSAGEGARSAVISVITRKKDAAAIKYPNECLGEWLRIDTGERWYISSTALKIEGKVSSKTVSLSKQSERVIEVTEGERKYYLFGFRIANAQFTGRIVSFQQPSKSLMRGIIAVERASTTISNLEKTVTQSKLTDAEGRYTADGIIPGDEHEVTPEGGTPTIVTPQFDGDDIGTITITQGVNLKTRIAPKSPELDMGLLYVNQPYQFNLEIENTGDADCTAATYSLDFGNAVTSIGTIGTIEPGNTKTIPITLQYAPTQNAYEYHKILVTVTDPIADKIFEDSVSLKIHKGTVNFNIRSQKDVAGIVITPDARAYYFKGTGTVTAPLSDQDYWVIFSGATVDTETAYSLGIDTDAPAIPANFNDTAKYESNNTEGTATVITEKHILAYLHKNDIDFYRINLVGLKDVTIVPPPPLTDERIDGFPAAPISISRNGTNGTPATYTFTIAEGYTSYKWYVDDLLKSSVKSLTLNAANYSIGKHTVTVVVYKNGVPYSKEQKFTVVE